MPFVSGLVDIHSHLLPGIDDGPDDLEGSLDMARIAVASGVTTMAATPHLRSDFPGVHVEEIGARCDELRKALDEERIPLRVVSGAEVSLVWALEASDEQLKLASYGQRGTDLLIETPMDVSMLENLLFAIRSKGFRVTLGHPERSREFQRAPERLERLAEQGVLLQLNGRALISRRSPPGRLADRLCRDGQAHVIASDGHRGSNWRPVTDLPKGVQALCALVGEERARWMSSGVPRVILSGTEIPAGPAVRHATPRRWLIRRRPQL
jgi:protein-tyrosine phosphatase